MRERIRIDVSTSGEGELPFSSLKPCHCASKSVAAALSWTKMQAALSTVIESFV